MRSLPGWRPRAELMLFADVILSSEAVTGIIALALAAVSAVVGTGIAMLVRLGKVETEVRQVRTEAEKDRSDRTERQREHDADLAGIYGRLNHAEQTIAGLSATVGAFDKTVASLDRTLGSFTASVDALGRIIERQGP